MNELIYPRERTLGAITLVLGLLIWTLLLIGTFGVALVFLLFGYIGYLFAQSALIAHIRGNGVELSEHQFPDLYKQFSACCDRLEIGSRPDVYVMNGNGGLNAFATHFWGTQYVVLYSDVVDAMSAHPDGIRFYIGHELGHLRMKHLRSQFLRWPALWLPLLGAAYSRARESTCDRHGRACSSTPDNAARALAALAAGSVRWKDLDTDSFARQTAYSSGFWMSFHELTAAYPWLTKRAVRVMDPEAAIPARSTFAYVLAAFVPYAGRLGGGFGALMLVYVVGVLAAIAIPAYQDYVVKSQLAMAVNVSVGARDALAAYYDANQDIPESLEAVRLPATLSDGSQLALDAKRMVLTVTTQRDQQLIFVPQKNAAGQIIWQCHGGETLRQQQLPPGCTK